MTYTHILLLLLLLQWHYPMCWTNSYLVLGHSMQVMTHLEAPLSRLLLCDEACAGAGGCVWEGKDLELTRTSPSDRAVPRECA